MGVIPVWADMDAVLGANRSVPDGADSTRRPQNWAAHGPNNSHSLQQKLPWWEGQAVMDPEQLAKPTPVIQSVCKIPLDFRALWALGGE